MKRLLSILSLALLSLVAHAQETEDDMYRYKIDRSLEPSQMVQGDTSLFYRTLRRRDLYEDITAYRFSFVETARRGFYYTDRAASIDGISLRHANLSVLRRLGLSERGYSGLAHDATFVASEAGADAFSTGEGVPLDGGSVALFFSGKGYLGGVRATVNSLMRRDWSLTLHAAARGGDDLYVRGVFNNSIDGGLRLEKQFRSGASFALVAVATIGERGLRSGSTEEAFTLTGNKLYNPAWGYQSGEVRTSRRRADSVPFVVATFSAPLGDRSNVRISLGGDYGTRAYSSLGWYNAMTPRPDNYRYLPSYYTHSDVAAAVSDAWRRRDERYTQIDWAELYAQNRMSSDGAVYALDDRVERIARAEAVVQFSSQMGDGLTLHYGLRAGRNSSRNYKRLSDLMGATHLRDIDHYLLDDDSFSRHLRNNLRRADDLVTEGDRFSYDYDLVERTLFVEAGLSYSARRLSLDAYASIGNHWIHRNGHFEKELFPAEQSYGPSRELLFRPYTLKASIGYALSLRHHLTLRAMMAERASEPRNLFLNPLYNNLTVDNPTTERHLAAELDYSYSSPNADLSLAAYYTLSENARQTYRAYDDLSATYADVDISRLGMLRYGVEAAAEVRFSQNWRASLSASAGEYLYSENPLVAIYDDADNSLVAAPSESFVGDCHIGGAPQLTASAEITYLNYRGWIFSLGASAAAMRYVDPSFTRRTERVAVQGSASEEIYQLFLSQQRLDDAWSAEASLSRWFDIGRSRLSLTLSVRNLLGYDDIVYGGYESSRIRNYKSGERRIYSPQDDIITYSYPRTYYAVVSWKF